MHYSTDYVFDGTKHGSYSETDTPNPINVCGKTKLAGDLAIEAVGHWEHALSSVMAAMAEKTSSAGQPT